MSATSEFLKLRSKDSPKAGEWNFNFMNAMDLAKKDGKTIITCWSNGDYCQYCMDAERCMTDPVFRDWMKGQDVYFVFQYSGDPNKGMSVHDWVYEKHRIRVFPGFRITRYDKSSGDFLYDEVVEGNKLRAGKLKTDGAKVMVSNLDKMLEEAQSKGKKEEVKEDTTPPVTEDYKIRLNESLTTKQVNKILDAIEANEGYCPCQERYEGSKCHCQDFKENKGIGEPCICKIYVKQKK